MNSSALRWLRRHSKLVALTVGCSAALAMAVIRGGDPVDPLAGTIVVLPPKPVSPFTLRAQLRSTTVATRLAATRSVLLDPLRYVRGTVRIAIANASRDVDPETFQPLATILSTPTLDDTTRGAAALALARLGASRAATSDLRWSNAVSSVVTCIGGGPPWTTHVRRSCLEAAGIAKLSSTAGALRATATSANEDATVALAASRSYTRLTGARATRDAAPIDPPPGEVLP